MNKPKTMIEFTCERCGKEKRRNILCEAYWDLPTYYYFCDCIKDKYEELKIENPDKYDKRSLIKIENSDIMSLIEKGSIVLISEIECFGLDVTEKELYKIEDDIALDRANDYLDGFYSEMDAYGYDGSPDEESFENWKDANGY